MKPVIERSARIDIDRRRFVLGAAAAIASPAVLVSRARAAQQVSVRTLGGAYEEAATKVYFEPFTKETGIEVVKIPATFSKLLAMHKAGANEIDLLDIGEIGVIQLDREGALAPIDFKAWKHTDKATLDPAAVRPNAVGHTSFSNVIGYNTKVFQPGSAPKSWADFWDVAKFPGPRMLADLASGSVDFEAALLADGVPMDKLYPIDVPRALKVLARIRPQIRKFWDTGALSAQMLTDQEVVLGSIWNTRLLAARDKGAPLGIEWQGGMIQLQCWAVAKGAKNPEAAQRLIDFMLQPTRQAALAEAVPSAPTNNDAFKSIPQSVAINLATYPENRAKQFIQNAEWWTDNRAMVSTEWSKWLLANR